MTHPFSPTMPPDTLARLLDRDTVARAYAVADIKTAGKSLGVGQINFAMALRHHGIRIRARGEPPPGRRFTKDQIELAVLRAYLRVEDAGCPPSCPGRDRCLDGECTLWEMIG